jgi:hypothetical protein
MYDTFEAMFGNSACQITSQARENDQSVKSMTDHHKNIVKHADEFVMTPNDS